MSSLVASAVNISEGRDQSVIAEIVAAFGSNESAKVLDVDSGYDAHRTVITVAGEGAAVRDGLFSLIKRSKELIDMSQHSGVHPRMGATDVCPFAPLADTSMEECASLAHSLGQRLGEELGISCFLYDHAAKLTWRDSLPVVRSGEYEGLEEKLKDEKWRPDYGPAAFDPKFGAIAIAAQEFLIAFNVNLNTEDEKVASWIAARVRESGGLLRKPNGEVVRDSEGKPQRQAGALKTCRAIGWKIDEFKCAQVSMNLCNYKVCGMRDAFEACKEAAEYFGVEVSGSELVGLVPHAALIEVGRSCCDQKNTESILLDNAVEFLGLNSVKNFDRDKKIIESLLGA